MIVNKKIFKQQRELAVLILRYFSRLNENTNSREELYYEIVLFSQNGGLQQI
jgi:hypothetical protein